MDEKMDPREFDSRRRRGEATVGPGTGGSGEGNGARYSRAVSAIDRLVVDRRDSGWGVRELAERLGEGRSNVNRTLQALVDAQLAERTVAGTYRTGPRLHVLADRLLASHPLLVAASPVIKELSQRWEATAILAVHDWPNPQAFVAAHHAAAGPVRYQLDPGTVLPLHAGAAGEAILAEIGSAALLSELPVFTDDTLTDPEAITQRATEDGARGYVISIGQHFPLAAGVAASLRFGGIVAAVSVTRPRYNTELTDLESFAPHVVEAARKIAYAATSMAVRNADHVSHEGPAPRPNATARLEHLLARLIDRPGGLSTVGRELGRQLNLNRATATKLLETTTSLALTTTATERYVAGPHFLRWASVLGPVTDLTDMVAPLLRRAAMEIGEAVGFSEYQPATRTAVMTFVATGPQPLQYGLATGIDMPMHAGAASKAILAQLPRTILDEIEMPAITDNTIVDRDELSKELLEIRERGWAYGEGERIPDAAGVAVPFFIDGMVYGSITVTVPRYRITEVNIDAIVEKLSSVAAAVSALLSVR